MCIILVNVCFCSNIIYLCAIFNSSYQDYAEAEIDEPFDESAYQDHDQDGAGADFPTDSKGMWLFFLLFCSGFLTTGNALARVHEKKNLLHLQILRLLILFAPTDFEAQSFLV